MLKSGIIMIGHVKTYKANLKENKIEVVQKKVTRWNVVIFE